MARTTYIPGPITITEYYDADGFNYPVGAIYMSTNSTSPATLYGGTWSQIQGKFLAACETNGVSGEGALNLTAAATGGAATHTLTTAQLPSHNHTPTLTVGTTNFEIRTGEGSLHAIYAGTRTSRGTANGTNYLHHKVYASSGNSAADTLTIKPNISVSLNSTGSGTAYSTMPPYLSVYMWERTA